MPVVICQGPTGQYYITNRGGWARRITAEEFEWMRSPGKNGGLGLTGPWPLNNPVEAAYIERIAV